MSRTYNSKLSPAINAQLNRRERAVRIQKRMLALFFIIIISSIILLGSAIKAFANTNTVELPLNKYYTSICVESGDSVWSIAEEYTRGTDVSIQDYVQEVCTMNHLQNGTIHTGNSLIVAYYSTDMN